MGQKSTANLFYLCGILILVTAILTLSNKTIAQSKKRQEIVLMAECNPAKELQTPTEIKVQFDIAPGQSGAVPNAVANIFGGPMQAPTSGQVLWTGWSPRKKGFALALIEGPRISYWAPCSPNIESGRKVKLLASKQTTSTNSAIYMIPGTKRNGLAADFAELPTYGTEGASVIAESDINTKTAEAYFGSGTKGTYSIGVALKISRRLKQSERNTISIGVKDE